MDTGITLPIQTATAEAQKNTKVAQCSQRPQPNPGSREDQIYSTAINRTTRAPAERNVSDGDWQVEQSFAPWSEENPFGVARSINISSLRDEETAQRTFPRKNQEVEPLYYREFQLGHYHGLLVS